MSSLARCSFQPDFLHCNNESALWPSGKTLAQGSGGSENKAKKIGNDGATNADMRDGKGKDRNVVIQVVVVVVVIVVVVAVVLVLLLVIDVVVVLIVLLMVVVVCCREVVKAVMATGK
ncbi:hypothetical protein ElyMa_001337500 [Elysia marginata]|uniref:Uncharacterized protein n=1 Tax=Elysia marginata TaxID=1093978 RepID=A0AAV4IMY5_9GAST|nr:hypothetical protein ElyMa_001337500 [Elysia marginata]